MAKHLAWHLRARSERPEVVPCRYAARSIDCLVFLGSHRLDWHRWGGFHLSPAKRQSWHFCRLATMRPTRQLRQSAHSRRLTHSPSPDGSLPHAYVGCAHSFVIGESHAFAPPTFAAATHGHGFHVSHLATLRARKRSSLSFCSRRRLSPSNASSRCLSRFSTTSRSRCADR